MEGRCQSIIAYIAAYVLLTLKKMNVHLMKTGKSGMCANLVGTRSKKQSRIKESDDMEYRVKVTEKHSDYVWVEADSEEEALSKAPEHAQCEFECLYDCEITQGCDDE
jgi:hypothetical protein